MPEFNFNPNPPQEALDYFRAKKLKPSFDYRDVWREEHGFAFTVAKAMKVDVLRDIHTALDQALAKGKTFEQFKKELTPTLQKKGWWGRQEQFDPLTGETKEVQLGSPRRLKTIYRTNMRTARAAGQWERIQRTKASRPYLMYLLGPSKEHRLEHEGWNRRILSVDDPFWQTHMPPNGYGCKCHVRHLSAREAERYGGPSEPPTVETREVVNKRSGEVLQVPKGIDPGFDVNPGVARQAHIQKVITTKINSLDPNIAEPAVRNLVHSPAFDLFLKKPQGNYPVAALGSDLKGRLNATQNAVMLSRETLIKQRRNHPELTDDEFRLIPDLINQGTVIDQGRQRLAFFRSGNRLYKAVVKSTLDGTELYLLSLFRTTVRELNRDKRRGEIIREQ